MFVIDSFSIFSFSVIGQLPLPYDHSFECYFEKPEAFASGFSRIVLSSHHVLCLNLINCLHKINFL